jgi:RHS repeat-associated protein
MLEMKVTDALGRTVESYTDARNRNRRTVQHAGGEDITVSYDYDPVNQVTAVYHPNGKTTSYKYDALGRKLTVIHPDAGETDMTYDAAGNLLTKLTAQLRKSISEKAPITYTYDYERLSEILYPENLFNRVTYTYGQPGDKYNRAGRLALVEDASGGEAYYYGRQGEVVKTVRTVMASVADIRTYVYGSAYDSWNRVRTMTYPDGEVVTYHYNAAGQVEGITSNKLGRESVIVDMIGYDKDGHTVYTKLGNGAEETYSYDNKRERLQETELRVGGNSVMANRYDYVADDTTSTEETFFYHSDHLGSTSYITDGKGNITQYDAYLPYGELLVDEHSSSEEMPYKFNGKEMDEETGLYYYGARYMNPVTSLWYGVDSRIEEMAFSSSYSYCDNHPINFIDKKGNKNFNWIILTEGISPRQDVRNNYDDNVVNIWAHGIRDPRGKKYRQQAWGIGVSQLNSGRMWSNVASYIPKDVSLFARRIDNADKGWRTRNNGHPILVLHSCASSTFAQEISASKEFIDVIIIAPDVTLHSTKEKGEWLNSLVYGKHYEHKRPGLWHVYMNGSPLKDNAGKVITYGPNAQPGTKGFDYRFNFKKSK